MAALLSNGCSGDVEVDPGNSQGSGGHGASSTSSGDPNNPCWPDSCSGPSSSVSVGTSGGGGGGAGGPAGAQCGGLAGIQCAADAFCDYPLDTCGAADDMGVCTPRPRGCNDVYEPTCGCDGVVHSNPCDASAAGVDQASFGHCDAPPGTFSCGSRFCRIGGEYCQVSVPSFGGAATSYTCVALPAACPPNGRATCACVAAEPCGSACLQDSSGNLTLTCDHPPPEGP